MESPYPVTKV